MPNPFQMPDAQSPFSCDRPFPYQYQHTLPSDTFKHFPSQLSYSLSEQDHLLYNVPTQFETPWSALIPCDHDITSSLDFEVVLGVDSPHPMNPRFETASPASAARSGFWGEEYLNFPLTATTCASPYSSCSSESFHSRTKTRTDSSRRKGVAMTRRKRLTQKTKWTPKRHRMSNLIVRYFFANERCRKALSKRIQNATEYPALHQDPYLPLLRTDALSLSGRGAP